MHKTIEKNLFQKKNLIPLAFILSGLYWFYLAFLTQMIITSDAIGYEQFGQMLYQKGWLGYFQTGPNREPLYPLLISLAMRIADFFNIPYLSVQKPLQVLLLFITQLLTFKILNKLNIGHYLKFVCLLYIGFSPSLVNSAFSLYSEIAAYPFVLALVLLATKVWGMLPSKNKILQISFSGFGLACIFIGLISVKAVFIGLLPIFLLPFFILSLQAFYQRNKKTVANTLCLTLIVFFSITLFILIFSMLNQKYNGTFAFTDRGDRIFYVAASLRTEGITQENLDYALRIHPHLEFSQKGENSFTKQMLALKAQGMNVNQINVEIFRLAIKQILQNPLSYAFFYIVQGIKILFWESMRIGFVAYPEWLTKVFNCQPLEISLHIFSGVATLVAILYTMKFIKNQWGRFLYPPQLNETVPLLFFSLIIILPFILLHSFAIVLPRFILPIVPLYLILIAFSLEEIRRQIIKGQ